MRELKFRVWSLERKCYVDVWSITFDDEGLPGVLEFEYGGLLYKEPAHDFIIEQYTGLKDKNGKEIYEGDIVKMPLELAIRQVGFVSFANGRFLIKDYEWEDGSYHIVDFFDYNIPNKDFEVIGNIHENHELCGEEEE